MANNQNDVSNIGKRIGRLLQQYELRIQYAQYKSSLMEEERQKASATGKAFKSMQATISRDVWEVYAKNLNTKKSELEEAVGRALMCYSDAEKRIWWAYFIENKSSYDIEGETHLNSRTVQRMIAAMKRDMELKFEQNLPRVGETDSPRYSASDIASFVRKKPSEEYVSAVSDLLEYGIVDLDALEFDPKFQDFIDRRAVAGDGD